MLHKSRKPQVLRLHNLEQMQRDKFCSQFLKTIGQILPNSFNKTIKNSIFLMKLLSSLPDIYYTLVTVSFCKRKLGEEYTYIAMYKEKNYAQEGLLLNKKTRTLLFIFEIISRNLFIPIFSKAMTENGQDFESFSESIQKQGKTKNFNKILGAMRSLKNFLLKYFGTSEDIMSNVEWIILMIYMLDWNKHFTFIESLLRIDYVYTYKNDQIRQISYIVEGYLLLITFAVKGIKAVIQFIKSRKAEKKEFIVSASMSKQNAKKIKTEQSSKEKTLCRICYDQVKDKSSTRCGHVFCWSCIIQTLEMSNECPVCRTSCQPRQVVQLRNY